MLLFTGCYPLQKGGLWRRYVVLTLECSHSSSAWITLLLSNAECLKVRDFGWMKLAKVFYQILFFFWSIHLILESKWHSGELLIVMTWLASLLVKGLESFMNTQIPFNHGAFRKVILVSVSLSLKKKWGTGNHSFTGFGKHFRFCNER